MVGSTASVSVFDRLAVVTSFGEVFGADAEVAGSCTEVVASLTEVAGGMIASWPRTVFPRKPDARKETALKPKTESLQDRWRGNRERVVCSINGCIFEVG